MSVEKSFQSGTVIWEFFFIFIAGCLGDMAVHLMVKTTNLFQGLDGYYKSLGNKLLFYDILKKKWKYFLGWFQGAIWGGIATVIALLIAKLFLYIDNK